MGKLLYGVGINDVNYAVSIKETVGHIDGKRKQRSLWVCPFYQKWKSMMERCYSAKYQAEHPTYVGCIVADEWKTFSVFRAWMEKQDWENKELDKDLLIRGNKVYGPDTCVFLTRSVNLFMTESTASRGDWPLGVRYHTLCGKFQARCCNPFLKKQENLGLFNCPNEAHTAWLTRKQELAILLAAEQTDERVAKAIIDRYMNYNKGENK